MAEDVEGERGGVVAGGARRVSAEDSPVAVLVVPTDEELEMARQTVALLAR